MLSKNNIVKLVGLGLMILFVLFFYIENFLLSFIILTLGLIVVYLGFAVKF